MRPQGIILPVPSQPEARLASASNGLPTFPSTDNQRPLYYAHAFAQAATPPTPLSSAEAFSASAHPKHHAHRPLPHLHFADQQHGTLHDKFHKNHRINARHPRKPLSEQRANALWLAVTKLISGGVIAGYVTSKLFGSKSGASILLRLGLGLVEVGIVDHLYNRKDSVFSALLRKISGKPSNAPNSNSSEPTLAINNKKLNLLSALVSAAYSFVATTGTILFSKSKGLNEKAVSAETLKAARPETKALLKRISLESKILFSRIRESKIMQWGLKRPAVIIAAMTLNGFAFGWLEAVAAQKAKNEVKAQQLRLGLR